MMISKADLLIILPATFVVVSVIASRMKTSPAILLVIAGVILALLPGIPSFELIPEVMLLFVLPPIIYSSAVAMSWREFRFNLRAISLLAIGGVAFTTFIAAAASRLLLGLSWPEGFVLGAIVSPPDAVAPLALARTMRLPRRILVVLEGEGLANDATALVFYRFAVAAVSIGFFSFGNALLTFTEIAVGEVAWGLMVGWGMLRFRRWVRDPRLEIMLSVLTPFIAYWPSQQLGGSGVLATVAAGLYISWNGVRMIGAPTRLQGVFFWDFITFSTEGMLFLVTGLQTRSLVGAFKAYGVSQLLVSAIVVSLVVILARFVWVFPAIYAPRWLSASVKRNDPAPPWQWSFALAYTGIRGIVSLAAALALPLTIGNGMPFPHRDLILFLTYAVILVTLVGQGMLLPTVIRAFGLENAGRQEYEIDHREEFAARRSVIEAASKRLREVAVELQLSNEAIERLQAAHNDRITHLEFERGLSVMACDAMALHRDVEVELLRAERECVLDIYRLGQLKDESRRRIEKELDLRDAQLANFKSNL